MATAAISLLLDAGVNIRTAHTSPASNHAETAVVSYTHHGTDAAVEAVAVLIKASAIHGPPSVWGSTNLDGARSTADRVAVPSTVFLTPPLARVGMTER